MGRFKPICDNLQFKSIWSDFKQLKNISNNLEQFRMILSNFKRPKQLWTIADSEEWFGKIYDNSGQY